MPTAGTTCALTLDHQDLGLSPLLTKDRLKLIQVPAASSVPPFAVDSPSDVSGWE